MSNVNDAETNTIPQSKLLKKAKKIAKKAHENQVRWDGTPYIEHPKAVARLAAQDTDESYEIVALLHDVVEDSNLSIEDLQQEGFTEDQIEALELLTKQNGIEYTKYIEQILTSCNPYAKTVKICDITHNLSSFTKQDRKKKKSLYEKYKLALFVLKRVNPATLFHEI